MRRRYNLIFIIVMGLILLFSLVACNHTTDPGNLPDQIGGANDSVDDLPENSSAGLKFTFPVKMSSIFNSIYVDEFELSDYVHYSVVYYDEEGAVLREIYYGSVIDEMIVDEDKQYLSVAGHHNIRVKAVLDDNTTVSGVFELHLKDRSGAIELAKFTFKLKDTESDNYAYPFFGTLNDNRSEVSVNIENGVTFNTWEDFTRVFQMNIPGKALLRVIGENANISYSATNGFPFMVSGDETFRITFTEDVVRVVYDLNVPESAVLRTSADHNPEDLFKEGAKYGNVTVQREVGTALQPTDAEINLYQGYTFAGWFNTENNTLWRFTNTVGNQDLHLQAHWVLTEYSFTVYTMGGVFADNLEDAKAPTGEIINETNAATLKYILIESSSRFTLSTGELNRITFTGFQYDMEYDKYVARVTINSDGDTVMLKFSDIYDPRGSKLLTKGGDSLVIEDLYYNYQCTQLVDREHNNKVSDEQTVTYLKWVFDEPDKGSQSYAQLYLERMSNYYTNVVFKDGYTILADGSVRLDQIADWTVNELIVPAEIKVGGEVRKVTEIGERALANAKAITKLDLSKAVNLTTIGTEAFAHATYLAEIVMPENNSITNIGDNAFWDTAFEDKYTEINQGAEFIVIGSMIYKYVGADKAEIDLSSPESYYSSDKHEDMSAEQIEKFNRELMGVTSIEDGAFARCPSLETLSLPSTITTIRNNALSGLENFRTLNISEISDATAAADEEDEDGETDEDGDNDTELPPYSNAKHSLLLNIGETAFDGTPFLSESGNLYDNTLGAIIIGNVYYRFLNKNATVAEIPDVHKEYVITHIAAQAFGGCTVLEKVNFGNESLIESIEKNAFTDTKILRDNKANGNPFTVYNGILTDYFGNTVDANAVNLIIPEGVNKIATNAFGQYGHYFETLQIGTNVKTIENYAFSEANMLTKIILTGATVQGGVLTDAPSIGEYAFANANGEMRSGLTLYFDQSVIQLFTSLESSGAVPQDKITAEWLNLYKMHKGNFEAEAIASVVIDKDKIANVLLQTSAGSAEYGKKFTLPFVDTYGQSVNNALIITSNTNVERRAELSVSGNSIELILLQDPETVTDAGANKDSAGKYDYSSLWKSEWKNDTTAQHYVLYYTYTSAPDKCMVDPANAEQRNNIFVITVYSAIKGDSDTIPAFTTLADAYKDTAYNVNGVEDYEANSYINRIESEEDTRTFWFTGLDGQIANAKLPTYYTSYPEFKNNNYSSVVFHYIDVNGVHRTLTPSRLRVTGLNTESEGNEFTAYIQVDFYGVGTYNFKYTYSAKVSRYIGIEQTKTINIPVNANAFDYLRNTPLNLIGEDGNKTPVNITSNVFGVIAPFDTANLGMHSVRVTYTSNDADGTLTFDVHYLVVLEADESMFTYERFNDSYNYARITGLKSTVSKSSITTLVLPSKWTDPDTKTEYTISQIGFMQGSSSGIFEGCTSLSAVYLPETIQCIGVNTFNGCANLKYVYTAIQADSTAAKIDTENNLEIYGAAYTEIIVDNGNPVEWTIQPVKLTSLDTLDARASKELIIAGDYVISEENHLIYRIVAVEDGISINAKRAEIDVYLPDTIYFGVNILDSDALPITPYFYTSGSTFMIKTANYVPEELVTIGQGAFKGCVELENIDFSYALNLKDIGAMAFAYSGLKSIDLSNNTQLTEIHNQVFDNCIALESVILHNGITSIGERAFNQCYMLQTIEGTLDKLEFLGTEAFSQAKSLTRFDLYDSLIQSDWNKEYEISYRVGKGVFAVCPALTIYCHFGKYDALPDGWNELWNSYDCPIVWNCDTNEVVEVVGTDNVVNRYIYYVAENGLRYQLTIDQNGDTMASLVGQAYSLSGDIVIPEKISYKGTNWTVTTVKLGAFEGNDRITSVTVSSSLKNIESSAFANCTSLSRFEFSDSNGLEKIAATAFNNTALSDVPQVSVSVTNQG